MSNLEKYNNIFNSIFNIKVEEIQGNIDTDSITVWDSITHLKLITSIEDEFEIMFESDEILDFKSYEIGKEILNKYNIMI